MTIGRHWKARAFLATSLDGFIARENGDVSWLENLEHNVGHVTTGTAAPALVWETFFPEIDTLVMGLHTYQKLLTFGVWPFDDIKVIVLSTSLSNDDKRIQVIPSLSKATQLLSDNGARNVYVDGGATIRSFLREGLLDEITVSVAPVILGSGIALFTANLGETRLRVLGSHVTDEGLVRTTYEIGSSPR